MNNIALKTTLSAFLVSLPLAGAFAQTDRDNHFADRVTAPVDVTYTSSIGSASTSYARQLDAALNAAETNLRPGGRDNVVGNGAAAQLRGEINAVRQAAAQEKNANGGELSAASYQNLSGQLRSIQQSIYGLQNGS
ncbi:hypothetical protein FY036_04600 [Mesorhizobium microcysteis]|uniref:Uncharacterized protein n=1 Tax=Neoaquamicrobium microcysteis TaxID=2682781 RepID=A0A5D4H242_9HYPH|nr:hypothetical protein [Mesorhizobium microcysteis]TYR34637.1 hypothetical protein FY036_04600 [Mesorhizobium microcysteis]